MNIVDWNTRTKFCSACGRRTILLQAGHKRSCPDDETECISHTRVQNFTYPRTGTTLKKKKKESFFICSVLIEPLSDPVIIVCIIHPTEDKILLGRQKRWPARMYSCIAGNVPQK